MEDETSSADRGPAPIRGEVDAALRTILEGTAGATGTAFFPALVENLATALGTCGALLAEHVPAAGRAREDGHLRVLAFWLDDKRLDRYEQAISGTPCEAVVAEQRLIHIEDRLADLYPRATQLGELGIVSYLGAPLLDADGAIMGHLAALDRRSMPAQPRLLALFQIFAARAAAELRQLRAEQCVRERDAKLGRLVAGAMDAIVELDRDLRIRQLNPAAESVFRVPAGELLGRDFGALILPDSRAELERRLAELDTPTPGARALWFSTGLSLLRKDGNGFVAEATLSRSERREIADYTLILRDVNDRIEAQHRIASLSAEAEYLREELLANVRTDQILGESPAFRQVLADAALVAATDATVLIHGETGTGKELFARAIHRGSARRDRALVKLDCAAIPSNLMESEFFGRERGAFTGATQRRVGRVALANHGTLFLDEVGELPFSLQDKLLRVLQKGEFEAVGSSQTARVDVRIIAATNRNLISEVHAGRFREDLFYRLSVFPLELPALRERPEDIARISECFVERIARRLGRTFAPLTPECIARLRRYSWPGNVRELENVIERAAVISQDNRLDLDRALPEAPELEQAAATPTTGVDHVLTAAEFQALERANMIRALEIRGWRIAGDDGAARLLGMSASALSSRMKALAISPPTRPE